MHPGCVGGAGHKTREAWSFDLYDQMIRLWEPFRGSEIILKLTKVQRTDLKLFVEL